MTDSDDFDRQSDSSNSTETYPTREEIIAEIHRIRDEIKVYPALSDFDKRGRYDSEEIYRHFDFFNDAIKAAKAAPTSIGDEADQLDLESEPQVENTTHTVDSDESGDTTAESRESDQSVESSGCTREEILDEIIRVTEELDKKPSTVDFHRNSKCKSADTYSYFDSWGEAFDAAIERRPAEHSPGNESQQVITIRITDDGSPLRGAHVTVGGSDSNSGQTNDQGEIEIQVSGDSNRVPLEITHRRWANKNLTTDTGEDTHSYTVDISASEWRTDDSEEDTSPESEHEDEPSDMVNTIFQDIDSLEDA